jgi:hypothetical protein
MPAWFNFPLELTNYPFVMKSVSAIIGLVFSKSPFLILDSLQDVGAGKKEAQLARFLVRLSFVAGIFMGTSWWLLPLF